MKSGHSLHRCLRHWKALLLITPVLLLLSCQEKTIPHEILGKWRSEHPRYASCVLEIDPKYIAFNRSEGQMDVGLMTNIHVSRNANIVITKIQYLNSEKVRFTTDYYYTDDE